MTMAVVRPFEDSLQIRDVIVTKHPQFGATESRGVDDRRMGEFVYDDHVILTEQRADGAKSSGVSGGKRQCCFHPFETRQSLFEFVVRGERSTNQPRSS